MVYLLVLVLLLVKKIFLSFFGVIFVISWVSLLCILFVMDGWIVVRCFVCCWIVVIRFGCWCLRFRFINWLEKLR